MSQALQLSSEQSRSVVALWHNFNQQVSKLLEARHGIHKSISETAHSGIDGQEFAQKYLQVECLLGSLHGPCKSGCTWKRTGYRQKSQGVLTAVPTLKSRLGC